MNTYRIKYNGVIFYDVKAENLHQAEEIWRNKKVNLNNPTDYEISDIYGIENVEDDEDGWEI